MAYSTSLPPMLMVPRLGGNGVAIWSYQSVDPKATVNGAGYITNAGALGMAVNDIVFVKDTDTTSATTIHYVVSISNGAATLGFAAVA